MGLRVGKRHHAALLKGIHVASCQTTDLQKVAELHQATDKSPSAFLECLWEAYSTFTPPDWKCSHDEHVFCYSITMDQTTDSFCEPWQAWLRKQVFSHSFVLMLHCSFPILGWDLHCKWWAQILFTLSEFILTPRDLPSLEAHVLVVVFPLQEDYHCMELEKMRPLFIALNFLLGFSNFLWARKKVTMVNLVANIPPVVVESVGHTKQMSLWQYPMTLEEHNETDSVYTTN